MEGAATGGKCGVASRVPAGRLASARPAKPQPGSMEHTAQVLLRARPTVSKDDLVIFEKYTAEVSRVAGLQLNPSGGCSCARCAGGLRACAACVAELPA